MIFWGRFLRTSRCRLGDESGNLVMSTATGSIVSPFTIKPSGTIHVFSGSFSNNAEYLSRLGPTREPNIWNFSLKEEYATAPPPTVSFSVSVRLRIDADFNLLAILFDLQNIFFFVILTCIVTCRTSNDEFVLN